MIRSAVACCELKKGHPKCWKQATVPVWLFVLMSNQLNENKWLQLLVLQAVFTGL
jgi:hypothetical protein